MALIFSSPNIPGFYRTVLVIWPFRDELSMKYPGSEGFCKALEELEKERSCSPSPEQVALAKWVARQSKHHDSHATETICSLGIVRKDVELCGSVLGGVSNDTKLEAIEAVWFDVIRP